MRDLVLATRNPHKVREIRAVLEDLPVRWLTLDDFPQLSPIIEDGATLEANATKKAVTVAQATSGLALADDSGLEVEALTGVPGVFSARFAGPQATYEDNNRKLLELLINIPLDQRQARFRCVIAVAEPDGTVHLVEGRLDGCIAMTPRGSNGFGYDPVFVVPDLGLTLAELPTSTKNRISHRARALHRAHRLLKHLIPSNRKS